MRRGIDGKVAIVTGGARGIGRAVCARLHGEGARVAVVDSNGDAALCDPVGGKQLYERAALDADTLNSGVATPASPDRAGVTARSSWSSSLASPTSSEASTTTVVPHNLEDGTFCW